MADQIVQDIKDRLDIAEVLGGYIQLKKAGTNFKAPCPFHNEKTPSLMISSQKQIWHCFGCGEGGDIFGFIMRYENMSFPEALRFLADKAGVVVPERRDPGIPQDEKERLIRINTFAAKYYNQLLEKSTAAKQARDYLEKRGLTTQTISRWQIGYAPDDFHALEEALAKKSVTIQDLVKAGVSVKNERGQMYDRFRNRITFPIVTYTGEIVGFSARTLSSDPNQAKYINSPETIIYNKSRVLFGLYHAREAIRQNDNAVVVEGQMDCISLHQAGFQNTVATSGTAMTTEHLKVLGRMTKNLIFCFDADSAGDRATRRAGELALAAGFRTKVVVLPQGKDPDELVQAGAALWQDALNSAVWFIDLYLDRAAQLASGSVEQIKYVSENIAPLLSNLTDVLEQDHYVRKLVDGFGLTESVVRKFLRGTTTGVSQTTVIESHSSDIQAENQVSLEKLVLGGVLAYPEFLDVIREDIIIEDFSHEGVRNIISLLVTGSPLPQTDDLELLAKEAQFMVESQIENLQLTSEAYLRELQKQFYTIRLSAIRSQQQQIGQLLRQAEQQRLKEKVQSLNEQFAKLTNLRSEYEHKITTA